MKYQALLFIIMFFPIVESINAQNFKENFKDSTLRIDYIFSGNTRPVLPVNPLPPRLSTPSYPPHSPWIET